MAKKVEKPPWKTEEPMLLIAFLALYTRFSLFVIDLGALMIR